MTSIIKQKDHLAEIRRTLQLAAPVIIGQLAVFSMSFVDTVMAGRLPNKEVALAGLGIGGAVWSVQLMFVLGLLMAVQPSVAQLDGAGRQAQAGAYTRQAFWVAAALAFPFWAFCFYAEPFLAWFRIDPAIVPVAAGYLRALSWGAPGICLTFLLRYFSEGTGHTRPTMIYGVLGALLNIPLNYVLMFGKLGFPAMGTVGCGIASTIVIWISVLMLLVYLIKHKHFIPFALFSRFDAPDWKQISEHLRVGFPIAISIFVEGSLFVGAALLIGRLGPVSAASHLVAINFSALAFMIPVGLSSAISIRVGNAIGRADPLSARYAGLIGITIVLGFQTISASAMFLIPELIVSLYTADPGVAHLAVSLLFYAAIFQYSDGIHICAAGALRGLKDTLVPMVYTVISFWLIGMTLGYHLTFNVGWGPAGMWVGMIAGLSTAAVLMLARFQRGSRRLIALHQASN